MSAPEPSRFAFLDGLRGLCALYIAIYHVLHLQLRDGFKPYGMATSLTPILIQANYAVDVFLVLSGFCLMLPVVRRGSGAMTTADELGAYVGRRARRILPAYYAAIAFALVLALVREQLKLRSILDELSRPGMAISHLLLIHNASESWAWGFAAPLWSLATEWQIYFLFPLVLLPLYRRLGGAATIAAGFAIGMLPIYLFPHPDNWMWAKPWFLGNFALGMVAAALTHDGMRNPRAWLHRVPWWLLALLLFAGWKGAPTVRIADMSIAASAACLILECSRRTLCGRERSNLLLRMLSSRALVALGAFSYSLYLLHWPIESFAINLMQKRQMDPNLALAINFAVVMPFVLVVAYGFSLLFEPRRSRSTAEAVIGTSKS